MIPLAGGLGGYKSEKGWQGACGAVCGGCAATGVILGGKERMPDASIPVAYLKSAKFATDFEKEFLDSISTAEGLTIGIVSQFIPVVCVTIGSIFLFVFLIKLIRGKE